VLKRAVQGELPVRSAPQLQTSLQAFVPRIERMAEGGAFPKSIYDALRLEDPDFRGSLSAVKRVWRAWRKGRGVRANDVVISVDTAPGQIAQVDFGYVGQLFDPQTQKMRNAWVFVCVLGFSRHMFAKVVFDQRAETWVQLHVEAFAWFGGVPAEIVPDNLKAAVVRAAFGVDREQNGLNRSFIELARHYGFQVDPTPVRDPRKKGKVESGVKYVKRNFFRPRAAELTDIVDAQARLDRWVLGTAGLREHGTLRVRPLELFEAEEKAALIALPARPYIPVDWKRATVHPNSHVLFDRREYSVPWRLIGQAVWVRATPESVYVLANDERVATHARRGPGLRSTDDAHLPEGRRELRHRSREYWVRRARVMDESVAAYVEAVFATDDVLSKLRVVQAIVTLLEKHPRERAIGACRRASTYGAFTYAAVRDILRQGLDLAALPEPMFPASSASSGRFARSPQSLPVH
jgi:transposase